VFRTEEKIELIMEMLKKERGIISVQPNYIYETMTEPMGDLQNINKVFNMDIVHQTHRGGGMTVAVVDTGVDINHEDLKERILEAVNLIKGTDYRGEIHGTAVCGVMAASINHFGIAGMAPEANILALRACRQLSEENPSGACYTVPMAKALDLAIKKKANIVNMSLGTPASDELLAKLIAKGASQGVLFVAPVGNQADQKAPHFPASHEDVLSVAGLDENDNPVPNRVVAKKATVSALAANIFTTIPGNKHNFFSGTSMAASAISGLLAACLDKKKKTTLHSLPAFTGDICRWQEELLQIPLCRN
jgi:subtilisin family serine protease